MAGKLFIVGTPIGNLKDITFRAVETLQEVDLIAAEDTRQTRKLLSHFGISTPLTSYYEQKKREKGEYILKRLLAGESVALVSDAGMPAISDPGEELVKLCLEHGVELTVIPGPTAFTAGLVLSGLPTGTFRFAGFLTVKKSAREQRLEALSRERDTLIFYEAPHKLVRTLTDMKKAFGSRRVALCRELTKRFEEVVRGTIDEALAHLEQAPPRGEFVLVVEGAADVPPVPAEESDILTAVARHMAQGADRKEAIRLTARELGLPKREVYAALLEKGNMQQEGGPK